MRDPLRIVITPKNAYIGESEDQDEMPRNTLSALHLIPSILHLTRRKNALERNGLKNMSSCRMPTINTAYELFTMYNRKISDIQIHFCFFFFLFSYLII